jgi:cytidylate kinase
MKSSSALERYFSAHQELKKEDESKRPRERPFVTISREAGAGAHTVGEKLVEILNRRPSEAPWTLFDKELVDVVISQHNLPENAAEYMAEGKVSAIHELFADLLGISPGSDTLIRKTNQTLIALAQMGNCVVIGRGGSFATSRLPLGFHIRLVASPEDRIQRVQDYYKVGEKEAEGLMKDTDAGRKQYIRLAFDKDVSDPLAYHCVINTTSMSCHDAAQLLAAHLQR